MRSTRFLRKLPIVGTGMVCLATLAWLASERRGDLPRPTYDHGGDENSSPAVLALLEPTTSARRAIQDHVLDLDEAIAGRVTSSVETSLEGFEVELRRSTHLLQRVQTDREGRFSFAPTARAATSAVLLPREGWHAPKPFIALDPHARASGIRFQVEPLKPRRLEGRVVNALTLEPLPLFALRLHQEPTEERVLTDEHGEFETRSEFANRTVGVTFEDWPIGLNQLRPTDSVLLGPEVERIELHASVGPTFRLLLSPETADPACAVLLPRSEEFDPASIARQARVRSSGQLRWVRLGPPSQAAAQAAAVTGWKLVVCTLDGRRAGEADVDCAQGICTTPVAVQLEGMTELSCSVHSAHGPVADVDVALVGTSREYRFRSDAAGQIHRTLKSGTYECTIQGYEPPVRETIDVIGDGPVTLELLLPDEGRTIAGTVSSTSGHYTTPCEILLERTSGGRWSLDVGWKKQSDGSYLGEFKKNDLPPGAYFASARAKDNRLPPLSLDGGALVLEAPIEEFVHWEPPILELHAPDSRLSFTCRDLEPRTDLGFHVVDGVSGATVPSFHLFYSSTTGWNRVSGTVNDAQAAFHAVAEGRPLDWVLLAPDYRLLSGTRADFQRRAGRLALADLVAHAGFSLVVEVTDSHGVPIGGAEVVLDERTWDARTDPRGYAVLDMPHRPARMEVRAAGYASVDFDLEGAPHALATIQLTKDSP